MTALAGGAAVAGCGTGTRENRDRPPVPLNVTAIVTDGHVSVSPRRFGAGPTVLTVANQSGSALDVRIEGEEASAQSGPIADRTTGKISEALPPGIYDVIAEGDTVIEPVEIVVTRERSTSQDDLLLP